MLMSPTTASWWLCVVRICVCANAGKLLLYILVSVPKSWKVYASSYPKIQCSISITRTVETSVFSPGRSGKNTVVVAIVYMVCRTGPWQEVPLTWRWYSAFLIVSHSTQRPQTGEILGSECRQESERKDHKERQGLASWAARMVVTTGSRSLPLPRVGAAPRTREAGGLQRWSAVILGYRHFLFWITGLSELIGWHFSRVLRLLISPRALRASKLQLLHNNNPAYRVVAMSTG